MEYNFSFLYISYVYVLRVRNCTAIMMDLHPIHIQSGLVLRDLAAEMKLAIRGKTAG